MTYMNVMLEARTVGKLQFVDLEKDSSLVGLSFGGRVEAEGLPYSSTVQWPQRSG